MPHRPTDKRRALPLLTPHKPGRSAMTCEYRCGNACDHPVANTSDNPYLGDLIAQAVSRRSLFRAGVVASVTVGTTGTLAAPVAASSADAEPHAHRGRKPKGLKFEPVEPNTADAVTIPSGYRDQVVIRWGDPVLGDAPEFDPEAQNPEAQAGQFGYNCDYLALLRHPWEWHRRVMWANHEYTDEELMFPGYDGDEPTREQVEIAWAAHGGTVVALDEDRHSGDLTPVVGHKLNRRITATTEFELTGPAAGGELLKTSADPTGTTVLGMLNNCGGGTTPWGTVLTAEENFNQYFANAELVTDPDLRAKLNRYGMSGGATGRKWERFDPRFDLSAEPNEANRFGWIVEIDPYDPDSTPRKHTALGRFKHEAANPRLTRDGHVVVYMGDDERFDYFYKFVSKNKMKKGYGKHARRHNMALLDEGTLYVAKFTGNSPAEEIDGSGALPSDGAFDGGGEWIALASGDESFVEGMSAEEVYVYTRMAADEVGATKMDRPEDVEPHPYTGDVYIALTNNSRRGADGQAAADEANPRNTNRHGQVVEVTEKGADPTALEFSWNLLLVCGDPEDPNTYYGGFPKDQVSPISCPDNLAFDPWGNLWISTDGNALGSNDGLFGVALKGSNRGQVKQFLTVPVGAETCGPIIEDRHVLVAAQHPGEVDGSSFENPASVWPDGPGSIPRPSVVNVTKQGFGRIGC
ncbi:PhoX family phosphatase [Glycomyces sp. L485]|uniref:PhoX family protein n=1 Tax=Glycomyces sp. L485 TaxID=2909235 RepID=UPI001F4A8119|nr:PhoX family phosphatase [Glycomyces sp. L485]MCH7233091.1 PhoX family phosphatase [Glycomyces sp. L485]